MEATVVVLDSFWIGRKKKREPHLHEFKLEVPEQCLKVAFIIHSYSDELQQNMGYCLKSVFDCRAWVPKMKISFKQNMCGAGLEVKTSNPNLQSTLIRLCPPGIRDGIRCLYLQSLPLQQCLQLQPLRTRQEGQQCW